MMKEPAEKKESLKESTKVLENFDGHRTKDLRDKFNSNIKWAALAFSWNFTAILIYMDWNIFLLDFFAFMVPFGLNVAWLFLKEEHQLKSVKHHAAWMIFLVINACLFILFLICAIYYAITMILRKQFNYLMKPDDHNTLAQNMGYYVLDMWVVTSMLLTIIFVLNALHTYSFVSHVYHKRQYLMQNDQ